MTDLADGGAPAGTEPEFTRKSIVLGASGLMSSLLLSALMILPPDFAITEPGPTYDTLGTIDDEQVVQISGAETFPASGELRLTTVRVRDTRDYLAIGTVIQGYFSPYRTVAPASEVLDTRDKNYAEVSKQDWITSQEAATVAALEFLGMEVPATVAVGEIDDASEAVGELEVGDVIVAVDGVEIVTLEDVGVAVGAHEAGDEVTLTVERDGVREEVAFPLMEIDGEARMGIIVDPTFDLPVDVEVAIDSVGGPSAGLMFALAITDLLTEEDELGGAKVAGTGEISVTGDVGPIGGIQLKMAGARLDGADYFLAPVENCPSVVGHIPDGLSVVAVDTLDDAYEAIVAIGRGEADDLPRCEAVEESPGVNP